MLRHDYPQPCFIRKRWAPLNGQWDFEIHDPAFSKEHYLDCKYSKTIEVPFAPGTLLSGVDTPCHVDSVWYKRTINLSARDINGRIHLNFLASSTYTDIYLNGQHIGLHTGGNSPFCIDITNSAIVGPNILIINNYCTSINNHSSINKNCICGLWKSVWLEFSDEATLWGLGTSIHTDGKSVFLHGMILGEIDGHILVTINFNGIDLGSFKYVAQRRFILTIPLKLPIELWQVGNPKIYDFEISLRNKEGIIVDAVKTYFAFRTVRFVGGDLLVSDKKLRIRGINFPSQYTDSGKTAPSLAVIRQDISVAVSLGFNTLMVQGVAEPALRCFADRLGLILIESSIPYDSRMEDRNERKYIVNEWAEIINSSFNSPSIIFRQPLFKYCGDESATNLMYSTTRTSDPARLILSGGGLVYNGVDAIEYTSIDATPENVLQLLLANENGFFKSERQEHAFRKSNPTFATTQTIASKPKLLSAFDCGSVSYRSVSNEYYFIKRFSDIIQAADSANAIGTVYHSLTDTPFKDTGILTMHREMKLSRNAIDSIFKINTTEHKGKTT
ncbi:MAG: hypothetical protein LBU04_07945 [Christensenellaceae bacterium]|jgi:hypothetical protein|nr:hypothetical protein [Christensenellaceae bacterium]